MKMTEQEVCEIIAKAQRQQLAKPANACVNSEAAFVEERIQEMGYKDIASKYWSWHCKHDFTTGYNEEVRELQKQLVAIDKRFEMPAWGTYGT
jgi:hypothetical protein